MKIINEDRYQQYIKETPNSPYKEAVLHFSMDWADYMELDIEFGKMQGIKPEEVIASCADRTYRKANESYNITQLMYGYSVSLLSQVWEYGEILRRWHNSQYAHYSDGVVNPVLLWVDLLD